MNIAVFSAGLRRKGKRNLAVLDLHLMHETTLSAAL